MRAGNHAARAMTVQLFRDAGYRVADSEANFVMADVRRDIRVSSEPAETVASNRAAVPPLLSWARITIGTMAEMQQAVEVFRGALSEPSHRRRATRTGALRAAPRWHLAVNPPPGLCGTCRHAQVIPSDRGQRFIRCARSDSDPRYARYLRCRWRIVRGPTRASHK